MPDNDLIAIIRDDKLSKSDFISMLPEYLEVDEMNSNIAGIVEFELRPLFEDIDVTKKAND
jgi:hypothetical protein